MRTGLARGIMLGMIAPLTLVPVSAQAGTRASETATHYFASASAEPGLQRAADGEEFALGLFGFDLQMFLIGSAAIGILVAIAIDDGGQRTEFHSNGAN